MTKVLVMTLTPQLQKLAIKKRVSHPSSVREPNIDFRKLVEKLEQAEITMKFEETENLKVQKVNDIQTTTSQINNIHYSDTELAENFTQILNIYKKNPNFKGEPSFKKWCNYYHRYGHSIAECRQKQQDNQNKPQKHREPNKSFYQYRNFNDDSNTSITKKSYKKESITSIFSSRTRYRLQKPSRKTRTSRNHYEI